MINGDELFIAWEYLDQFLSAVLICPIFDVEVFLYAA